MAAKKTKKPVKKTAVKKAAKAVKKTAPKKSAKKSAKKAAKKAVKAPAKAAAKKKPLKKATQPAKKTSQAAPKKTPVTKNTPSFGAPAKATPVMNLQNFITPLDDRMLIRLTEAERRTPGGLYIPDTVADVSGNLQGQVVAIGRGHRDEKGRLHPLDVKVGDRVLFTQYSGSKIKIQNEDLIILRESEVMGVVSK